MEEFDVVVIGGGPAGLSAAARAVWLGVPSPPLVPRVLLIEASHELGGLCRWQPLIVNSPGNFFTRRELRNTAATCLRGGVVFRQGYVRSLSRSGDGWRVATEDAEHFALAVVIAVGLRRLFDDEVALLKARRLAWVPQRSELAGVLQRFVSAGVERLMLVGAVGVGALRSAVEATGSPFVVRSVAEPPSAGAAAGVDRARLTRLERRPPGLLAELQDDRGQRREREADALIVDFDSYQAQSTTLGFLEVDVPRLAGDFLGIERSTALGTPGLFAAGDATGPPFSVSKAVAEGTAAGFAAYAYVVERRLGVRPDLFPYWSTLRTP